MEAYHCGCLPTHSLYERALCLFTNLLGCGFLLVAHLQMVTDLCAEEWGLGFRKEKEKTSIYAFQSWWTQWKDRERGKKGLHARVNMEKLEFKEMKTNQPLCNWLSLSEAVIICGSKIVTVRGCLCGIAHPCFSWLINPRWISSLMWPFYF